LARKRTSAREFTFGSTLAYLIHSLSLSKTLHKSGNNMPYVENQTIHDADSHIMELPGMIDEFMEQRYRKQFDDLKINRIHLNEITNDVRDLQADPEFRAGAEANLMLRKNQHALGAFIKEDRSQCLDLLGFSSQLVFTTEALSNYGLEHSGHTELALATASAHNRMMTDFCSVDKRLLPTGYVPLVDVEAAIRIAKEALDLGCKGLVIPSRCPASHSPSHIGFDPLWSMAEEAGIPILLHVGGERKMEDAYNENGLPRVTDFHGGDENFTALSYMSIPIAIWQTMSALIIDGVLDRHPKLKFGAIELGASWLPSWMRFLDAGVAAFTKGEKRLQQLSEKPSDIARRQFRVTPYPNEDTKWIIENSGDDMLLFSSDFPHVEGGRNPLKRFEDSLQGVNEVVQQKFYRDNFIDLMGSGLDSSIHDHPSVITRAP
jgi:predicted TIM-barrel fold metal-dependent hydrolase